MDIKTLQAEVAVWSALNFPGKRPHQPLLGAFEEVGELAHAHLKIEQQIRGNENLVAKRKDAVGDILVYLADYCTQVGVDMNECVEAAWNEVKERDWVKYPKTGRP